MTDMLVREDGVPSEKYGQYPWERSVQELLEFGVVVVDKPSGPTSHQTSAYVQQVLGIEKSGHSGTLDPKVTGVLPMGLGGATRLLEFLLKSGKEYVGVMHVHADVPEHELQRVREEFVGRITQLPPKRSSVKRQERERTVYEFEFLEVDGRDVLFRADVEAGTYLRKICSDFGEALGPGAHMAELRRTRVAHYDESQAVSLQTLADVYAVAKEGDEERFREVVLPGEDIVAHLPAVVVLDSAVNSVTHGATLKVPGICAVDPSIREDDVVRLVTIKDELVAVGTARMDSEEMFSADRGVAVKPDKVVMDSDVYPRMD